MEQVRARAGASTQYVPPESELEERLASIWRQLLGITRIGRNDNFFELGGDSLLVARVVSGIRDEIQVKLPLKQLFEYPTIAGLAIVIEKLLSAKENEPSPDTARNRAKTIM